MRFSLALLSRSMPLLANGQAQLLPAGEFKARDGRPGPGKAWKLNDEQGQRLAAQLNTDLAEEPLVIDYEHQTFNKEKNGQPAPAAGWVRQVEWLTGKGLVAAVDWTKRALGLIADGEYKYISPVIRFDRDTHTVTGLQMAALTNTPALKGMDAVQAALTALNGADDEPATHEDHPMKLTLAALAALLGNAALINADDATAASAIKAWKPAPAPLPEALTTALGLQAGADEVAALSAVNALKTPSTATVQLVTTLQAQVAELTTRINAEQVAKTVDEAIAAGKLTAAQRDQYIQLGNKDLAMLTAIVAAAPVIPGLAGQDAAAKAAQSGADKRQAVTALTTDQAAIATQLGIPHADYLKTLQAA